LVQPASPQRLDKGAAQAAIAPVTNAVNPLIFMFLDTT
jgi:hypothetical protein